MAEKTTVVYFVRHGTIDLKDGEAVEENPPLNKEGTLQAKKLGEQFRSVDPKIDLVVTSSMRRAVQTAKIICKIII